MKRCLLSLLALLLCLSLAVCEPAEAAADGVSVLDRDEMQALLDDYISSHRLNPDKISIGYIYTETGDSFYYNEDTWYYSASMYKVPVMMLLAEKEYAGELTRDTKVMGLKLGYAEDAILTHSNNEFAHMMMAALAPSEPECRELYKKFVDLPDDYYDPDFLMYSYFTARFMTGVMQTLYNEPERFPNIIDCLLNAQPEHYFRRQLGEYQIAQKYGSFKDNSWRDFNHTTGIIYLPHPIILTVMTQDAPEPESVIGDLAKLFADYTGKADERLETLRAEEARLAAEEEARREAERQEQERAAAEEEAARLAAEEGAARRAAEEQARPAAEAEAPATAAPELPVQPDGAAQRLRLYVLAGAAAVLLASLLAALLRRRK